MAIGKNGLKMKRFWLFLTIVFLSQAVCFAGGEKPKKITKLIYFEGSIDKKKPIGHGKLILDRYRQDEDADYYIEGNFSDDKITNAVFYINRYAKNGTITGELGFAINEKEGTVTLTLNNVTFSYSNDLVRYDLEHISLGTVVIGNNKDSNWKGMGFIQDYVYNIRMDLPFDEYPKGLKPLIGPSQCTREALVNIKCKKGIGFFDIEDVQFISNNYKFKNGATYKSTDDESGVYEIPGSDMLQVGFNNELLLLKNNSIIQLKDKSTLKITNWEIKNVLWGDDTKRGKWDIEVDGEITFTDGAKYNGTLLLSQLSRGEDGWGMTVYNYFKNRAPQDLYLDYGKLISSQGTVTEYIQNKTKEEIEAEKKTRLLAEEKAQAKVQGIVDDWFAGRNQITFKGKEIGRLSEVSAGIGLVEGDILYDCKLVLNKDGNGTLTYKLSPTESAFNNQRIHYMRNGRKQRHGDFVTDFCNTINSNNGSDSGKWFIDGSKLKCGDYSIEISEDRNKIELEIIDYCTLYLVK